MEASSPALVQARLSNPTTQPHAQAAVALSAETEARKALQLYCTQGRGAFAERYLQAAAAPAPAASPPSPTDLSGAVGTERVLTRSLYAAAAEWIEGGKGLASRGALREVACIGFRCSLALGALSPRRVLASASAAGGGLPWPFARPPWGITDSTALMDVVEWYEWHRLLATRDVTAAQAEARVVAGGGGAAAAAAAALPAARSRPCLADTTSTRPSRRAMPSPLRRTRPPPWTPCPSPPVSLPPGREAWLPQASGSGLLWKPRPLHWSRLGCPTRRLSRMPRRRSRSPQRPRHARLCSCIAPKAGARSPSDIFRPPLPPPRPPPPLPPRTYPAR
mmetsp:Transcript_18350/g.58099  ORF Transcript_18350/g.58099 Transcript_18350/m.58099 type:complete len:335 (-) Transcript_18350:100-1104(-)